MPSLVLTTLTNIPLISPGDDLPEIIIRSLRSSEIELMNNDILVITGKIVAKAEGRFVNLRNVIPSERAEEIAGITEKDPRLIQLILSESNAVLRVRKNLIIVEHKQGFICANGGIDHSNVQSLFGGAEDWVLLLPEDGDRSAVAIRGRLEAEFGVKIGILIIDSHGRAWRMGTVGVAIGVSGLPGLLDLRGKSDLFGYQLRATQVGVADELAAAASLLMGQANEGSPIVLVHGFPYELCEGSLQDLIRPEEFDMFR